MRPALQSMHYALTELHVLLEVLGLQDIGIPALGLTHPTSKQELNAAYECLDTNFYSHLMYNLHPRLNGAFFC